MADKNCQEPKDIWDESSNLCWRVGCGGSNRVGIEEVN